MSKIIATLDPHRVGDGLTLAQGNLVVTTTKICDIHRSVFATLPIGAGMVALECKFWSNSQPAAGLANLCSLGVAENAQPLTQYVGEGALSWGYRPTEAAVYHNNASISGAASPALQATAERQTLGFLLDMTGATPIAAWFVNGNLIFQANLTTNKFYVAGVSIGSTIAGDVSAVLNFGQNLFDYPVFSVLK